jgi:hypothetical protein
MKHERIQERRRSSENGQAFLIIAIFIAMLLLAMLGVATDYTQLWARRQMAQGAADAACQAGAADLFLNGTDPTAATDFPALDFSWIGTSFDCGAKPGTAPCQYASLNGYTGSKVSVSFPTTLPGVGGIPAGFPAVANPYIKVTVTDAVAMWFTKLVSSTKTINVTASASCGLSAINAPVPLVVLHRTAGPSLQVNGSASVTILGGPQRSIQVDSSSNTAVSVGTVNLQNAGPSGTGADFAVFGGPPTQPAGVNVGSTGHWLPGASPFGDPFASISAPAKPTAAGTAKPVPFGINGCPDPAGCVEFAAGDYTTCSSGTISPGANGCLNLPYSGSNPKFNAGGTSWQASQSYAAGALIKPSTPTCANTSNSGGFVFMATTAGTSSGTCPSSFNQIRCTRQSDGTCSGGTTADGTVTWQNVGVDSTTPSTAIFDPGLYYVGSQGLSFGSGTTARVSAANGDGSRGAMFYFNTSGSVSIGSSSGSSSACTSVPWPYTSGSPNGCLVPYNTNGSLSSAATGYVASTVLKCPSGSATPSQVPATLSGNILLGPCGASSGIGGTGQYGSPDGNRGFLFFQNRSTAANAGSCTAGFGGRCAILGGGGSFIFSGFIYFHNGNGGSCGSNTSCLTFAGGSGGDSFTIGNIVLDKVSLTGSSRVTMILNPLATFSVLRPTLLR